jgi:hypothetical protein
MFPVGPTFPAERLRPARNSCKIAYQRGGLHSAGAPELGGPKFSKGSPKLKATSASSPLTGESLDSKWGMDPARDTCDLDYRFSNRQRFP